MIRKPDLKSLGEGFVYIKPIAVSELPDEMRAQVEDQDEIVVVHNHAGERIAFVSNAQLARDLAREYDMHAVHVH